MRHGAAGKDVRRVAISADGKQLLSGSFDGTMRLWDLQTGKETRCFDASGHFVEQVAFTRDGKRLISVGDANLNRGYLAVWDVPTGKLLYGEELPLGTFHSLAVSPDESLLAIGAGPRGWRRERRFAPCGTSTARGCPAASSG